MGIQTYRDFARSVIETLESLGLVYMIGGAFASIYYGEVRTTMDIDIAVLLPLEEARRFVQAFEALGYYVSLDAIIDATIHDQPFNIIDAESGYKADFFLIKPTELERSALARRRRVIYDESTGAEAYLYSPEDVIIYKLKYYLTGRIQKHLRDIAGILVVQGEALDFDYIERWAAEIGASELWEHILAEYRRRFQQVT
jgi:hypothetical protein